MVGRLIVNVKELINIDLVLSHFMSIKFFKLIVLFLFFQSKAQTWNHSLFGSFFLFYHIGCAPDTEDAMCCDVTNSFIMTNNNINLDEQRKID